MAHRNPVIHGNRVELFGDPTCRLNLACDQLAKVFQMHMAGHKLGKAVDDGDDRLAEVAVFHARCAPQSTGTGHIAAMGRCARAVHGHFILLS